MEIWHFFVIFYDFVMKCVYKSTIYTFVIRDKIWTPPPFVVQKCTCYFCVLGPENTPHPIHVRHFCVSPPPPDLRYIKSRPYILTRVQSKAYTEPSSFSSLFNLLYSKDIHYLSQARHIAHSTTQCRKLYLY